MSAGRPRPFPRSGVGPPVLRAHSELMARTHVSVIELCSARAVEVEPNRWKAAKLAGVTAAFIDEWARYMRETGEDDPTTEAWAAWANVSPRTGYYRLRDFRRLFGEWHDDPSVLARHVNRALAAKRSPVVPETLVPA